MLIIKTYKQKTENITNKFYLEFLGVPQEENIDCKKLEQLIDNCFTKFKTYNDMVRNVSWIRTILSDIDERHLKIVITNTNGELQKIEYMNKKLSLYEITKNIGRYNNTCSMQYDINKGMNFSFPHRPYNYKPFLKTEKILEFTNDCIKSLESLKNISPINLDEDSKVICEIYKLFYNEYPDFSSKDINIKIQSMLAILTEFSICINDNISFMMNHKNIPISLYLNQKIDNLTPLGKIEVINNPIKLSEHATNVIKVVSESIKEFIPEEYDEIEVLSKISSIIYTKNNIVSSKAKNNEIANISHSAENEVTKTLKLVKNINEKIKLGGK